MADSYIHYPLDADAQQLADEAIAYLVDHLPGWEPSAGHLEVWLIEALANMTAQALTAATDVPRAIFRAWGPMVGVPPIDATNAIGATTWSAVDNAGYTIPEGTLIGARIAGDQLVAFEVTVDVVIPPGSTQTATGQVPIRAVDPGAVASGLTGPMELIDALSWVDTITLDGSTGGGVDAEPDDTYLARLSRELELMSPRPVLPDDFSVFARRVAGVGRATTVDGLDPVAHTTGNERMVTVAVTAPDGTAVPGGVRSQVKDLLERMREVSFIVHVIDPAYQSVDVAATVITTTGYDGAAVGTAVEDALTDWLSPARWGMPGTGDDATSGGWDDRTVVSRLELAHVIHTVDGVERITALTVNGGTSDVTLNAGDVTLPTAGTITVTVI